MQEGNSMKHVFKATKIGWGKEKEAIWFDSEKYTAEEARKEFKTFEGTTQRGYPYTGHEYDGQRYHDIAYLGEFEDEEIPHNNTEFLNILMKRLKK